MHADDPPSHDETDVEEENPDQTDELGHADDQPSHDETYIEEENQDQTDEPDGSDEEEESDFADEIQEFNDNYKDVLESFSEKWLLAQLTHKVSEKATNHFWNLTQEYMPTLMMHHQREGRESNVPGFINQRKKLHRKDCPQFEMEFGFQKKSDGSLKKVLGSTAPLKSFQHNKDYIKLYEVASVKVKKIIK